MKMLYVILIESWNDNKGFENDADHKKGNTRLSLKRINIKIMRDSNKLLLHLLCVFMICLVV